MSRNDKGHFIVKGGDHECRPGEFCFVCDGGLDICKYCGKAESQLEMPCEHAVQSLRARLEMQGKIDWLVNERARVENELLRACGFVATSENEINCWLWRSKDLHPNAQGADMLLTRDMALEFARNRIHLLEVDLALPLEEYQALPEHNYTYSLRVRKGRRNES